MEARVLALTLRGLTAEEIARETGRGVVGIERIRTRETFKRALEEASRDTVEEARGALRDAAGVAVAALIDVASGSDTDSARVSAARAILGMVGISEESSLKLTGDLAHRTDAELAALARQIAKALGPGDGDTNA